MTPHRQAARPEPVRDGQIAPENCTTQDTNHETSIPRTFNQLTGQYLHHWETRLSALEHKVGKLQDSEEASAGSDVKERIQGDEKMSPSPKDAPSSVTTQNEQTMNREESLLLPEPDCMASIISSI